MKASGKNLDPAAVLGQTPVVADGAAHALLQLLRSRQKCKSSPVKGLLLEHFPFEEDRETLSLSSFICEPTGSLRSFKFVRQSTDIELNLYHGLETLQSALNGEKNQRASCPAPSHCPRLPSLAGESACQFNHAAPLTGIFHSASPVDGSGHV